PYLSLLTGESSTLGVLSADTNGSGMESPFWIIHARISVSARLFHLLELVHELSKLNLERLLLGDTVVDELSRPVQIIEVVFVAHSSYSFAGLHYRHIDASR